MVSVVTRAALVACLVVAIPFVRAAPSLGAQATFAAVTHPDESTGPHQEEMTRGPGSSPLAAALADDADHILATSTVAPSFAGLSGTAEPSDGTLAVGPSHVLQIVNGQPNVNNVAIYDKNGRQLRVMPLTALFGIDPATYMTDPRAYYDPVSARWYVLGFGLNSAARTVRFYFGISLSGDPLGGFCEFSKDETRKQGVSGSVFPDFPGLGADDYAFYVTSTRFNFTDFRPADLQIEMFPRSTVSCAAASLQPWVWNETVTLPDGQPLWHVEPAVAFTPSGSGYFVGTSWNGGAYAGVWSVTHDATPRLLKSAVAIGSYSRQADAAQPGSAVLLDASDTRVPSSPVFRNGSLWFAFTARAAQSPYSAARWYELRVPSNVVAQQGEVWSPLANWMYPALTVDATNGLTIATTYVGPQDYVSSALFSRSPSDPPGTLGPASRLARGTVAYIGDGTDNPVRWGDYFGIALDPDGQRVWVESSYSRTPSGWETIIAAAARASAAARPSSYRVTVSDASPFAGTAVTVTAQALDASGSPLPAAGEVVTWSATPAGVGSFSPVSSTTNASGAATASFTTSATPGITYTVTASGTAGGGTGTSAPFTSRVKPAPTTTLYLPNVTKTLGGPDGFQTPFIVQNVGATKTDLEVSFMRFSDGRLVTKRVISGLAPGASYADVPNNDADLPGDTQFSVKVESFGAPVVSVVNQHRGNIEADAYAAASTGATSVYLPNVVRRFYGFHSPIIIQNLGSAAATVNAAFTPFAGGPARNIARTIAPGQSQFIEPNIEPSLTDGAQYSVVVSSAQPVAVVVNTHNDDPGVEHPYFYSANGIATGAATLYGAYFVKNANGQRNGTIVVQNVGTTNVTPTLTFTQFGGGAARTFTSPAALAPGTAWAFDPRFSNGVATSDPAKACSAGAANCLADGEFGFTAQAQGGNIAAMVNIFGPDSAMGYTATPSPATKYFLPNVTASYFGWTTPIVLQSAGATSASVTWTPFNGGQSITRVVALVPSQSVRIDPNVQVALGQQYAVTVNANGLVSAIVMELNTTIGGDNAMIYTGFPGPQP